MVMKITNDEFLERLNKKNYPYKPLDEYSGSKSKIRFKCDRHGEFLARPNDILNGQGCPKCGGTKKLTEEEFVNNASYVHNCFFTYDNCNFSNVSEKVSITCPIHGTFMQKANNHLNGQGCPKCKMEGIKHKITRRGKVNKSTKKISDAVFKERYNHKFGNEYDLSHTVYVSAKEVFYPICKVHGKFPITPNHLMMGEGCPKCAKNYHYNMEELVCKLKEIHGDEYIYDRVTDVTTHSLIEIGCKKHGYFSQMVSNHIRGQGCPICKESRMEREIAELLSTNGIDFEREKNFKWLGRKKLDFYLPKYDTAIECQGIQHFEATDIFGGEEKLEYRKNLDWEKLMECKARNIDVLYYANYEHDFPYEVITNKDELLSRIIERND